MGKLLAASPSGGRATIDVAAVSGHENSESAYLVRSEGLPALAARLAVVLERKDPDHGGDYRRNLETFLSSLKPIEAEWRRSGPPMAGRRSRRPSRSRLHGGGVGFEMLNVPFQFAMMNGTEPTPSKVAGFERSLREGRGQDIVLQFAGDGALDGRPAAIAKEAGVPVVGVTETEPKDKTIQSCSPGRSMRSDRRSRAATADDAGPGNAPQVYAGAANRMSMEHLRLNEGNASMTKIGLIGVGLMGHGIGKNIIEKGWIFISWMTREPADDGPGRTRRPTPRQGAGRGGDLRRSHTLRDRKPQVEEFSSGRVRCWRTQARFIVVDCSTALPSSTRALAAKVRERAAISSTPR